MISTRPAQQGPAGGLGVVHGFTKKTPTDDIALARKRKEEMKSYEQSQGSTLGIDAS